MNFVPQMLCSVITACMILGLGGCASTSATEDIPKVKVPFNLSLEKSDLALGEGLVVKVEPTDPAMRLTDDQMEFWLLEEDQGARQVWPVTPEISTGPGSVASGPRYFVFTRATIRPGAFQLVGSMTTPGMGASGQWSDPVPLSVTDEVLFERDGLGLLTIGAAEELAKKHLGQTELACRSRLVPSAYGLQDWEIEAKLSNGEKQFLRINPYTGVVRDVWQNQ